MTIHVLQADTADSKPCEFERLYRAWRYAKAQWDLAENDPANPDGLAPETTNALCDVEHAALIAFFMHPTTDLKHIARKLRVYIEQEAWQYSLVREVVERIHKDIHDVAFGYRRND